MRTWSAELETEPEYSRFASRVRMLSAVVFASVLLAACGGRNTRTDASTSEPPPPADEVVAESSAAEAYAMDEEVGTAEEDAEPLDAPPSEARRTTTQAPLPVTSGPAIHENAPLRYVVKKGDTLWDIADHFLKEPWKWPELWYGNPGIKNPHLIYPGDVLYLTYVDGRPRLSTAAPSGYEKLSPHVREEPLPDAIPTIPGDAIRAFLRGPRVVGAGEMDAAPYVLDFTENHLIGGAGIAAYVKNLPEDAAPDQVILRKGKIYRDPDTNEILGYEGMYIGTARVTRAGQPAKVMITTSDREVLRGDRVLPQDESDMLAAAYYPHASSEPIEGRIIDVIGGVLEIGQYQIVTLNRGEREGVEIGHVFTIWQATRQTRDPYHPDKVETLPEERAGHMLVFKTYEKISYALVLKNFRSVRLLDKFRTPEP